MSLLSPESAVRFLISRGVIHARDVVRGDLCVEEVGGRNHNLRLESHGGPGCFAKQAPDPEAARLVRIEASVYAQVRDDPRWMPLRAWLPVLRLFDESRSLLVTEAPPFLRDVFDVDAEGNDLDLPNIGDPLGRALAACHCAPVTGLAFTLEPLRPWTLRIHRPHPRLLRDAWRAQLEVLRRIQNDEGACAALDALSREWQSTSLIHGDLKFSNVLVAAPATTPANAAPSSTVSSYDPARRTLPSSTAPAPSPTTTGTTSEADREPELLLVDWETASLGDPAWDVGSVFQSYLWFGVHLVSSDDETDAAAAPRAFAARLPAVQRCIRTFWEAYRREMGLTAATEDAFLLRSAAYTGARLLQTAFESSQGEEQPGRLSTGSLQLALNVLRQPADALRHVLGIQPTVETR